MSFFSVLFEKTCILVYFNSMIKIKKHEVKVERVKSGTPGAQLGACMDDNNHSRDK